MKLFSRVSGSGEPLIILHGLFGMSDNWQTLAKQFADFFEVHLLDHRNHGRSFHDEHFSYKHLSDDLYNYIQYNKLSNVSLIGHSLGGKTVMYFSTEYPQIVRKLVVVDISPKFYPIHHQTIIDGLFAVDNTDLKSRSEADKILSQYINETDVRQFLLKSLYWNEKKKLKFRFNLNAISKNIANVGQQLNQYNRFTKPTLFLKGDKSDYIKDEDEEKIFFHFPDTYIQTISEAGHWLHAEKPNQFYEIVTRFLL